jgi:hypothetical protein
MGAYVVGAAVVRAAEGEGPESPAVVTAWVPSGQVSGGMA